MRNLKRALSLAVASVMLLGMMVVGTAASYPDVDGENNTEAIEVLQAVGIMEGDQNGNFNPDQTLTRNEMAVIMSKLMQYNVASYRDTSPFTDVPAWAEPYVAACYTNGITAGIGNNQYGGDNQVTTAQAALMLMKALGYFQYASDFGTDGTLATIAQGNRIDLFVDVDTAAREPITRDDVAQLVLNTLEAGTVEPTDNTINVQAGDVQVQAGKVNYNYVTIDRDYARAISDRVPTASTSDTKGAIVELGEKLYLGDLTKRDASEDGYTDDFGRPANNWEYKAKEIGTYAIAADHVFTDKVTSKELYDAVGKTASDNYTWFIEVNGETVSGFERGELSANHTDDVADFINKAGATIGTNATVEDATGNGVVTEVFVDGTEQTVHVAISYWYAAEVYVVDEADGTITLAGLEDAPMAPAKASDEFVTDEFEEDEVVIYSYAKNRIQEVKHTGVVEGDVTRVSANQPDQNGNNFVVDGETYKYNKTMNRDRLTTENVNNNVLGYTDEYGYVVYIDQTAFTYDYAYVLSTNVDKSTYGDLTVYARLVLTDGTIVKAETNIKPEEAGGENNTTSSNSWLGHIVAYSKNSDGSYDVTKKDMNTATSEGTIGTHELSASSRVIKGGTPTIYSYAGDRNVTYVANADTVFIVAEPDKNGDFDEYDFTVYTGVKNVPDINSKADDSVICVAATSKGVAKVVYVESVNLSGLKNVLFLRADGAADRVGSLDEHTYYEIKAVVEGEPTTLKVKYDSEAGDILVNQLADGIRDSSDELFKQDIDGNDVVPHVNVTGGKLRCIVAAKNVIYNAEGLVTGVRLYENEESGNGSLASNTANVGTDKTNRDTVQLGGRSFAWDEITVARYDDYAGNFSKSAITTVKKDSNDQWVAVTSDYVLSGLCIVEEDGGEGQDPVGSSGTVTTTEFEAVTPGGTLGTMDIRYYGNMTQEQLNDYIKQVIQNKYGIPVRSYNPINGKVVFEDGTEATVNSVKQVYKVTIGDTAKYIDEKATTLTGFKAGNYLTSGTTVASNAFVVGAGGSITLTDIDPQATKGLAKDYTLVAAYEVDLGSLTTKVGTADLTDKIYAVNNTTLTITGGEQSAGIVVLVETVDGTETAIDKRELKETGKATWTYTVHADASLAENASDYYTVTYTDDRGAQEFFAKVGDVVTFTSSYKHFFATTKNLNTETYGSELTVSAASNSRDYTVASDDVQTGKVIKIVPGAKVSSASTPNDVKIDVGSEADKIDKSNNNKIVAFGQKLTIKDETAAKDIIISAEGITGKLEGVAVSGDSATSQATYTVLKTDDAITFKTVSVAPVSLSNGHTMTKSSGEIKIVGSTNWAEGTYTLYTAAKDGSVLATATVESASSTDLTFTVADPETTLNSYVSSTTLYLTRTVDGYESSRVEVANITVS